MSIKQIALVALVCYLVGFGSAVCFDGRDRGIVPTCLYAYAAWSVYLIVWRFIDSSPTDAEAAEILKERVTAKDLAIGLYAITYLIGIPCAWFWSMVALTPHAYEFGGVFLGCVAGTVMFCLRFFDA